MNVKEINAKTILRKHKRMDSWFISQYGMNLYRGCSHNCTYCDGRSEGYYVEGEFGEDIWVKVKSPCKFTVASKHALQLVKLPETPTV